MIAEVEGAELVDRVLNSIALPKNAKSLQVRSPSNTAIPKFADVSKMDRSTLSGLISTDRFLGKRADPFGKSLNR
jgi:hypothetical protein